MVWDSSGAEGGTACFFAPIVVTATLKSYRILNVLPLSTKEASQNTHSLKSLEVDGMAPNLVFGGIVFQIPSS